MSESTSSENGDGERYYLGRVETHDYRAIKIVVWEPPRNGVATIVGPNSAGKSSFMDSIVKPIVGGSMGHDVVRHGAKKSTFDIELRGEGGAPDLFVAAEIKNDKLSLKVREESKRSAPIGSPRATLDALGGRLWFDPSEFARMTGPQRIEAVLKAIGLGDQLAKIQADYDELFKERTEVGREMRRKQAVLDELTPPAPGLPDKPIDTAAVVEESRRLQRIKDANDSKREEYRFALTQRDDRRADVARLREELDEAEQQLKYAMNKASALKDECEKLDDYDTERESLHRQLAEAGETNEAINNAAQYRKAEQDHKASTTEHEDMTERLDGLKGEKVHLLAKANWPVPGMGLGEGDITYRGALFPNLGQAETVRISTRMGMEFNPKLRAAFLREAAWFDDDTIALVKELAEENDFLCLLELPPGPDKANYKGANLIIEAGEAVIAEPKKKSRRR